MAGLDNDKTMTSQWQVKTKEDAKTKEDKIRHGNTRQRDSVTRQDKVRQYILTRLNKCKDRTKTR
jgi:hypothetical protein